MKKILFLLIALATINNVSYASFPIQSNFVAYTDTLQTDKIKQYHSSLIKMGIDLNSCKCESCRNGIAPLTINRVVNKPLNQFQRIWLPIIIIMTILAVISIIVILQYVNKHLSGGTALG
jgi:hypothetical protein